jgi:hypothetical protein
MKAFLLEKYRKSGPLRLADVPEPDLREGEVQVRSTLQASTFWTSRSVMASSSRSFPTRCR